MFSNVLGVEIMTPPERAKRLSKYLDVIGLKLSEENWEALEAHIAAQIEEHCKQEYERGLKDARNERY